LFSRQSPGRILAKHPLQEIYNWSRAIFGNAAAAAFPKILNFEFFIKIKYDLYILDGFDVLISKINFKK